MRMGEEVCEIAVGNMGTGVRTRYATTHQSTTFTVLLSTHGNVYTFGADMAYEPSDKVSGR